LYFDTTKVKLTQTEQKVKLNKDKTDQNQTDKHKTTQGTPASNPGGRGSYIFENHTHSNISVEHIFHNNVINVISG
jgi:hypothetical protein